MTTVKTVSVQEFAKKLNLQIIREGVGVVELSSISVTRPGLQLAGYYEKFANRRVQIIGYAEHEFIKSLPEKARYKAVNQLFEKDINCLIIARGLDVLEEIDVLAQEYNCPVFVSQKVTTVLIHDLLMYLSIELAPSGKVHGVLLDVYGVGVLITGKAGIGKSETALELISRGHRLVADDTVVLHTDGERIIGSAPENIRYYMEVRGVGIINVKTMYGSTSVRDEKTVNMIVELLPWTNDLEYDRLGNERYYTKLLDSQVVTYKIPVQSGRNIPAIIEAASKKYRLEQQLGMSVAEELISKAFTSKE